MRAFFVASLLMFSAGASAQQIVEPINSLTNLPSPAALFDTRVAVPMAIQPSQQPSQQPSTPVIPVASSDRPPPASRGVYWPVASQDASQQLRQSGQYAPHAAAHGWSAAAGSTHEIHLWVGRLGEVGIPSEKTRFEARRLSRSDFLLWANGMILSYRECLNRVCSP